MRGPQAAEPLVEAKPPSAASIYVAKVDFSKRQLTFRPNYVLVTAEDDK